MLPLFSGSIFCCSYYFFGISTVDRGFARAAVFMSLLSTCVYICVVFRCLCPKISWSTLTSTPFLYISVAEVCRSLCTEILGSSPAWLQYFLTSHFTVSVLILRFWLLKKNALISCQPIYQQLSAA